jgi:hypothetical protein
VLPEEEERRWVADTLAKPGSQYWIVGHGGWQLHLRKEWRQPAQKAEDFAPPPSYPHSVVFYASFKGAEPPQRPRPSRIKRPG